MTAEMTDKGLIELVEEYGEAMYEHGHQRNGDYHYYDKAAVLLAKIRQRLEADAESLAGLERATTSLTARVRGIDLYDGSSCSVTMQNELDELCDKADAAIAGAGRG